MNSATDPLNLIANFSVWPLVKIFVCFAAFLYIIFATVVIRQIYLMTETLNGQLELPLKAVGILYLLGTIIVLFIAITTL